MDEYRKRLEENADEAEFALMIDDYLNDLGESLQNKYEEARKRGEAPEMPEDMKMRLRQFIANYNEPIETTAESVENTLDVVPNNQIAQRSRKWLRRLGVAAATIAILVGSLFTAQAAGFDVLGAIARWTNNVFYYERSDKDIIDAPQELTSIEKIQSALIAQSIPKGNTPLWLPERFSLSDLKTECSDDFSCVYALFTSPAEETIIIEISSTNTSDNVVIEKGNSEVETLNIGEKTFYLFQNNDDCIGTWSNGRDTISIYGDIPLKEMREIIKSIGGN